MSRSMLCLLLACAALPWARVHAAEMGTIPSGVFRFPAAQDSLGRTAILPRFQLDVRQVSTREFLAFLRRNPRYRRSRISPLMADSLYLASWKGDLDPPGNRLDGPVTEVSWFAAKAYCAESGKRLPTTAEWERAAAVIPIGMDSASYTSLILDWYARPAGQAAPAGDGTINALGIRDLVGKVWEWTSDFNADGVGTASSRADGSNDLFCGGSARSGIDRSDYAAYMRYSFRGSLKPSYVVSSLGFRCAR